MREILFAVAAVIAVGSLSGCASWDIGEAKGKPRRQLSRSRHRRPYTSSDRFCAIEEGPFGPSPAFDGSSRSVCMHNSAESGNERREMTL